MAHAQKGTCPECLRRLPITKTGHIKKGHSKEEVFGTITQYWPCAGTGELCVERRK